MYSAIRRAQTNFPKTTGALSWCPDTSRRVAYARMFRSSQIYRLKHGAVPENSQAVPEVLPEDSQALPEVCLRILRHCLRFLRHCLRILRQFRKTSGNKFCCIFTVLTMIESREGARGRDVISSDSGKGLLMVSKRRILCGVSSKRRILWHNPAFLSSLSGKPQI